MGDEPGRDQARASSAQVEGDRVVLRKPDHLRLWTPLMWLVMGGVVGIVQLASGKDPWWFVFVGGAGLLFWMGRQPVVVADSRGVAFRWKRHIPWREVEDVVRPPDDGWKHHSTELLLCDGTRRTFGVDVDPQDVERLHRLWAASRPDGPG